MTHKQLVKVEVPIARKHVRWVAKKLGVSEAQATEHIKEKLLEKIVQQLKWETFVVDDGQLHLLPVDTLHPTYNPDRDFILGNRINSPT